MIGEGRLENLLDLVESEAVDRRLAELREAVAGLIWYSEKGQATVVLNEVLALLTSDARDRSQE